MRAKTPVYLQKEPAECGAMALRSILAYYGRFVSAHEIRVACHVSRDGVRGDRLAQAARRYGLEVHSFRKSTISLRSQTTPFIALLHPHHFVVVERFSPQGVGVNDPAVGHLMMSNAEFDARFRGIIFTFTPQPDFQTGGKHPNILRRLTSFAKIARPIFKFAIAAGIGLTLLSLSQIGVLRTFIEDVLARGAPLLPLFLITLILATLAIALTQSLEYLKLRGLSVTGISHSLKLVQHLIRLPASFFRVRTGGELAAHFVWVNEAARFLTNEVIGHALSLLSSVAILALMFLYDPLLALIQIALLLVYFAAFALVSRAQQDDTARYQQHLSKLMGLAAIYLRQIESIKAVGTENSALVRLQSTGAHLWQAQQNLLSTTRAMMLVTFLVGIAQISSMVFVGMARVADGTLTVGAFAALQGLSMLVWLPLMQAVSFPARLRAITSKIEAVQDVLDISEEMPTTTVDAPHSGLTAHQLRFGYDINNPLFEGLSLRLEPGEVVAVVGASGSGKSSLARLLARLEPPWSGAVQHDGAALVDGNPFIMAGSLLENLTLWDVHIPYENVVKAVNDCELQHDVERMPGGYSRFVAEDGTNLSGGQRQQIQLARALVRNPTILILDEATSALDADLEQRILQNIRKRGCTCLIITHRLSTARQCDRIIVLERGQIIETGNQAYLMEQASLYAKLNRIEMVAAAHLPVSQPARPIYSSFPVSNPLLGLVQGTYHPLFAGIAAVYTPLTACQLAARSQGFELPVSDYQGADLLTVASASGVYLRPIHLKTGWTSIDAGPLVVDGERPLALIYHRGRYCYADPLKRSLTEADEVDFSAVYQLTVPLIQEGETRFHTVLRLLLRGSLADSIIIFICSALVNLAQVIPVLLIPSLLDGVLTRAASGFYVQIAAVIVVAALLGTIGLYTQQIALIRVLSRAVLRMHNGLWAHLLNLPIHALRAFSSADLSTRVTGADTWIADLSTSSMTTIAAVLSFSMAAVFIIFYSPALALALLLLAIFYTIIITPLALARLYNLREATAREAANQGWLAMLLNNVLHIRAANAEDRALMSWTERELPARAADLRARTLDAWLTVINTALFWGGLLILFGVVTTSIQSFTPGVYIGVQTAFLMAVGALGQLGRALFAALSGLANYDRLRPLLVETESKPTTFSPVHTLRGEIRLDNMTVRYHPDLPPALAEISLHIRAGEFVAIVGASGSGKTTLIRALLGFETPTSGSILYDEHVRRAGLPRSIRQQIGAVMQQDTFIIDGTIFYNIAAGRSLTRDQAWEAARAAGIADEIAALPMSMDTPLTNGSQVLSSGQRQRLLIARALAGNPRIMLFDEATAAVDDATQFAIMESLTDLPITRIFVAHRLSMVQHADRIIVLDKGRVVQSGTYEELRHQPGVFANLFAQMM